MAGTSLLALIDDIASILDDVAVLTKVATKKTSGVLGDDLALNAQQVSGVSSDREIPVVMAVARGSAVNKLILVPAALIISTFAPFLVAPLMLAGASFLCFEGFEKVFEKIFHRNKKTSESKVIDLNTKSAALQESEKIKGAIRTDFILSAEIIVISLGTVAQSPLLTQFAVLTAISILMTIGVYSLVAGIVKLDDLGLYCLKSSARASQKIGRFILVFAPILMKSLGVIGTAAMFLVGGGIVTHTLKDLHHWQQANLPSWTTTIFDGFIGFLLGGLVWLIVISIKSIFFKPKIS